MTVEAGFTGRQGGRRRRGRTLGATAALAVLAAACGSATGTSVRSTTPSTSVPAASSSTMAAGATVQVGRGPAGAVLANAEGRTLYHFSADQGSQLACSGSCLTVWLPLVVAAGVRPTAGPGATGMLGTVTRADGTRQVTYNGLALYTYVGDSAPGQTAGQGITEQYGSVKGQWSVVTPTTSATPGAAPATTAGTPAAAATTTAPKVNQAPATTQAATTTRAPATTQAPATTTTTAPYTTTTIGAWG